jgi:hypothetical protein
MAAKLPAGIDLPPDKVGLFRREEARARLASHSVREAVVRTMPSLGVLRTSATWLAALDRTLGQGAAAHRLGIGQICCELADAGRDIRRSRSSHDLSYGYKRRKTIEK